MYKHIGQNGKDNESKLFADIKLENNRLTEHVSALHYEKTNLEMKVSK